MRRHGRARGSVAREAALPDLRGAYLEEAYLEEAYLRGANLKGANLVWANLGA